MLWVLLAVFTWFGVGFIGAWFDGRGKHPMVAAFWILFPPIPLIAMLAEALADRQ